MKKKLIIEGMSCGHCVMHIKNALLEIQGVKNVDVNLNSKTAIVEMEKEVEDTILKEAIDDAGYEMISSEII